MADSTAYSQQVVREAPEVEAYRLGLLNDARTNLTNQALQLPAYNVAAQTPLTSQAAGLAASGVGAYQPYLQSAQGALTGSAQTYNQAQGVLGQGLTSLNAFPGAYNYLGKASDTVAGSVPAAQSLAMQGTGQYDPSGNVSQFFNPYLDSVVNQQYSDIARQGQIQSQQAAAATAKAGAYGGSRGALAQTEIGRNTLDTQARTGSQLRASGYQQALDASQKAYESGQARDLQAAQLTGQLGLSSADAYRQIGTAGGALAGQQAEIARALGLGIGSLGTEMGKLGVQEGALGELSSKLNTTDITNLANMGNIENQQKQRELDAQRATSLQQMYEPYQRTSYLMDLYKGTPSSQQTITANTAPQPSLASQVVGTGITALGGAAALNKSGLL